MTGETKQTPSTAPGALDVTGGTPEAAAAVDPRSFSLVRYARAIGRGPKEIRHSFETFCEQLPEMWAHVETAEERAPGLVGLPVKDYRLDAAGFMAFLFWRARWGRLPPELIGGLE